MIHSRSTYHRVGFIILLFLVSMVLIGCSRVSQEAKQHPLQVELVEPLFPPGVGKYTLNIRVFDSDNQPIDNATITAKADMTHAGMIPILAEATNGDKGLYKVPIEWTMGGDWVIVVQATLPDGTVAEETFPLTISSDATDCDTEETDTP